MKIKLILLSSLFFSFAQANFEFSDDKSIPEFAHTAIYDLYDLGIISGNDNGTLAPDKTINRAEFAKILVEATGLNKYVPAQNSFTDVVGNEWFYPYIEAVKKSGWINGYPDGSFQPVRVINRAEIAKMLTLAFEIEVTEDSSDINWYDTYIRGLVLSNNLPYLVSVNDFQPATNPTRVEVFEQLHRILEIEEIEYELENETSEREEATIKTQEVEYQYVDNDALTQKTEANAGTFLLEKSKKQSKSINLAPGETGTVMKLQLKAENGEVKMKELQFRISGNAPIANISNVWVEIDGLRVSNRVSPNDYLVQLPFKQTQWIDSNSIELTIKAQASRNAIGGKSSRFVIHLPTWIRANTEAKVGFFPFASSDIEFK